MAAKGKNLSIIDKDLNIEGELFYEGKLVVKGTIKGEITGESLIIAQEGSVFSNIKVEDITIGGIFEGNVFARGKVIVLSSGKCSGVVTCNDLIVESGGIINAEVSCTREGETVSAGKNQKNKNSSSKEEDKNMKKK
ncbi:MAG: hypothetical protein CSB21_03720 [Deltaproteobacteria bacterium]|nr:MAG: hypothetical protein CSB21_03720 [Deltaproteobacteria bacterium]